MTQGHLDALVEVAKAARDLRNIQAIYEANPHTIGLLGLVSDATARLDRALQSLGSSEFMARYQGGI